MESFFDETRGMLSINCASADQYWLASKNVCYHQKKPLGFCVLFLLFELPDWSQLFRHSKKKTITQIFVAENEESGRESEGPSIKIKIDDQFSLPASEACIASDPYASKSSIMPVEDKDIFAP